MSNDPKTTSSKSPVAAAALIIAGMGLAIFGYAHRPPEGLMDALQRADSWAFNPGVYYVILMISGLLALAGVLRLVKARS